MTLIAEAITEWFGERCPEYAEGCVCCEIWKEYDTLASPVASERLASRQSEPVAFVSDAALNTLINHCSERITASKYKTDVQPHALYLAPPTLQPTSAVEGEVQPVAYLSEGNMELLKIGGGGAYNVQISNVNFSRFTVPLYAAPVATPVSQSQPRDFLTAQIDEHFYVDFSKPSREDVVRECIAVVEEAWQDGVPPAEISKALRSLIEEEKIK
jgi:hypothetical protein